MNKLFQLQFQADLTRSIFQHSGLPLLLVSLLIHGCAGTDSVVSKGSPPVRDSAPEHPVDVSKIPDPTPRYEPKSKRGNPSSYVVWGKRYHVMNERKDFVQKGIASWYGKKFHGRKTSNGETYNMYAMTAAHKSLPLPSYLQVKNLRNGRTIVVRVNDRGPFHQDRIIDLSYTAAKKIGIIRTGTGYVEIRDITPRKKAGSKFVADPSRPPKWFVQIGAFKNPVNANKLLGTLYAPGLPNTRVKAGDFEDEPLYRVQLGPLSSVGEAEKVIQRLSQLGITSTKLISDPEIPDTPGLH